MGEKEGTHEAALKAYLEDHVSQVLWVVLAEQGIGKTEKNFHDAFFTEVCDDVIVTGCEGWDAADKMRFKRRFSQQFGKPMLRFHFISGLQGLVARNSGDEAQLASSGISGLEQRITELSSAEGRVASIEDALTDLSRDLHDWLDGFRTGRNARLSQWWRPDSWARWEAACSDDPLKLKITRILQP